MNSKRKADLIVAVTFLSVGFISISLFVFSVWWLFSPSEPKYEMNGYIPNTNIVHSEIPKLETAD